jgi:CotH kinase protein/Lamin Tail Domain
MRSKMGFVLLVLLALLQPVLVVADDFYDETVLRTLRLEFSQSDWWSQLTANYQAKENILATLAVEDVVCEDVGVRFRGNTSYQMTGNSQKKSFNIEIDYTDGDQRLMGYKTLNLINCMGDATFMREVLYSNLCRRQFPSAKANFVKLEINGENWGIYANVQQLNGEFIEDWFPSNNGTRWRAEGHLDGGGGGGRAPRSTAVGTTTERAMFAEVAEGGGVTSGLAALTWQGSDSAAYEVVYELKNTEQDDPWASLVHTCDVLNNTPIDQLADELKYVLDVDRALWACAFEIIFTDDDGYVNKRGSDYCLYYEPETGRLHVMQYDGNECMSNDQYALFYREDDSVVPLMNRLMAIDEYRQRYLAHVCTILDSFLTEEVMCEKIDAYRMLIEEEVLADEKKLESYQAFDREIDGLKDFVTERRDYLLGNRALAWPAPEIVSVSQDVVQEDAGESLTVTATMGDSVAVAEVQLFVAAGPFAIFESVPMADDGQHGDGAASDNVFGVTLSGYPSGTALRYYVQATADNNARAMTFSPVGAEHEVYTHIMTYSEAASSPIVFNELMARNKATIADPQGEYDDWIELKNISSDSVDLGGMYLSDNPEHPLKWKFPEGTVIEPGEYLLVWADEDGGDEPGLHANFKLASEGETIWLFDTIESRHALLDSVTFVDLEEDQSCGRYPDGEGPMRALAAPSPVGANGEPAVAGGP